MEKVEKATLGGGCFWCTEAVFQKVKGVKKIVSGYAGGKYSDPTYREVCRGRTGHAEVIEITYDANQVSFVDLLEIFFKTHDPTTLNRQGADVGTQYRSVIFYHKQQQLELAKSVIKKIEEEKVYDQPVVTELSPLLEFYPAEDYHQNYYRQNSSQPYCSFVIAPKVAKLEKLFADLVTN